MLFFIIDSKFDIVSCKLLAILPLDIVSQVENIFFAVRADVPAFRKPGNQAHVILFYQAVKYEVHLVDSGAPWIMHEGRRVSRIPAA